METAEWICDIWKDANLAKDWGSVCEMLHGAFQTSNELGAMEALDDYDLLLCIAYLHQVDAHSVERRSPGLWQQQRRMK
jgi:hypothetical protein